METRTLILSAILFSLGVFGVPTFRVGEELFWGQDRIEQVVEESRR